MSAPNLLLMAPEPVWKSWARDIVSLGVLVGSAIALNTCMPPSGWLNATLGIAWILWLAGRGLTKKLTPAEMRAWLDEHYPRPADERSAA